MATGGGHVAQAIYGLWRREVTTYFREKSRVISSLFSPLIWLTIVGSGIGTIVDPATLGGATYLEFFFPGVIAMSVLFGTVFFGLYIVWDRRVDALKSFLVAPVPRWALFLGKMTGGMTQAMVEVTLLLAIGWFLVDYPLMAVPQVILIAALIGAGTTAIGLFIGSFFDSLEGFQVIITFLVFPMFFLSGAMFPIDDLPAWLDPAVKINPLAYGVDALRGALLGTGTFPILFDLAILAGFMVIMTAAGAWSFRRMKA